MNDKKPFRVTNVAATQTVNATLITNIAQEYLQMYAADLIDARELNDKQEAIIKEAVAIIDHARKYGIDNACSCDDCKKADLFLEKTKEYI